MTVAELVAWHLDARERTLALVGDLEGEQLLGPVLPIVNPPLWEYGHVAWFHERWAWRHLRGRAPLRADADALYDSIAIAHDTRWHPGFVIDPYKEYSAPWFETHKVLRGGCWATRARLIRNTWRNFYTPDRRDVFAGFRTCAR